MSLTSAKKLSRAVKEIISSLGINTSESSYSHLLGEYLSEPFLAFHYFILT